MRDLHVNVDQKNLQVYLKTEAQTIIRLAIQFILIVSIKKLNIIFVPNKGVRYSKVADQARCQVEEASLICNTIVL